MQQTQEMWVPSQGGEDALVEAFQYSCQENPIDKGAWRATVHRVAKSQTLLSKILHPENAEESTKHLLEPINKFSKVTGYKNQHIKISCISIYL